MKKKPKSYHVFISAAEPSADIHCANLIKELRKSGEKIQFHGLGGNQMKSAGCDLLENMAQRAAMHYNVLGQLGYYHKLKKRVSKFFKDNKIDLVIVCDSPSWNFHIAKAAKQRGIKTIFYVAPQLWAWGAWRIRKTKDLCDKLMCILPFEEEWFKSRGVDAEFVGNPLFDDAPQVLAETRVRKNFNDEKKLEIALLPGSRKGEIQTLWLPMQKIASRLAQVFEGLRVTTVAANEDIKRQLEQMQIDGLKTEYSVSSVISSACSADLAIVSSGSATLQVAAAGCPMVVMYQSNKFLWNLIGKRLLKTRYLSLVNILAGKELVPEYMPYFDSIEPIFADCESLLFQQKIRMEMSRGLIALTEPLIKGCASAKAAKIVLDKLKLNKKM